MSQVQRFKASKPRPAYRDRRDLRDLRKDIEVVNLHLSMKYDCTERELVDAFTRSFRAPPQIRMH